MAWGRLAAIWCFCFASPAAGTERVRIDPDSRHFIGADGRTLLFHGVNVVQKSFPWHPSLGEFDPKNSLNAQDMDNLRSWGFNVIRLGIMWPGVEPSEGQFNSTYLGLMRQLVDDLHSHGIHTILDFHQDSLSEQWCGEGIPQWLLPAVGPLMHSCGGLVPEIAKLIGECTPMADFKIPVDPATGFPSTKGCLERTFDAYSRTPELTSAWGNFYKSDVVQQKFQAFWRRVATEFVGSPGVLGYDLINEPLNGNFLTDIKRLEPGHLDKYVLQPMYKALHDVIQAVDPSAISMYEPPPFPDTYPRNIPVAHGVHHIGATAGPAGQNVAHQALSYHVYSCGFADSKCDRQGDTATDKDTLSVCDTWANDAVSKRDADAKRLGGGVFLTEFGACSGSAACIAEINRVLNPADAAMQSWAYWQFKYNHDITTVSGPMEGFYHDNGTLQHAKVAALSRTYAPAVAGRPVKMQFEPVFGAYHLQYATEVSTAHMPTDIYLNEEMSYGSGYTVSAINATVKTNGPNQLAVLASKAGVRVDVAIAKKYAGAAAGKWESKDKDQITWTIVDSADSPGIELNTANTITWWKSIEVYTDDGEKICSLAMQDANHGPASCELRDSQRHGFLFNYRIEIWKAKAFGIHKQVDTISASHFGPLLNKKLSFTWVDDKIEEEEVVV